MILNMAGGSADYSLIVSIDPGSVVTAAKDGTTKAAVEKNGLYYFIGLEAGTWTVSAAKDGFTETESVTMVDGQSQVIAMMYNSNILYDTGDQCEQLTGGWKDYSNSSTGPVVFNANHIHCGWETLWGSGNSLAGTISKVDLTGYNTLHVNTANDVTGGGIYLKSIDDAEYTHIARQAISANSTTTALDVSAINEPCYIAIGFLAAGVDTKQKMNITKVWLE